MPLIQCGYGSILHSKAKKMVVERAFEIFKEKCKIILKKINIPLRHI
jgi:hypothetical protein